MNKDTHRRLVSLFFLMSIITLIAFFFSSYLQYYRLYHTHRALIESYQTIRAVNQTLISLDEAALNTSIFLQTKESDILSIIPESITTAQLNFETLQQLVKDDPAQHDTLEKLTPLLQTKIAFWKKLVTAYSLGNTTGALELASDKNRLRLTSEIKQYLVAIKQVEIQQLDHNEQLLIADKIGVKKILIFMGLLCAFFFICSFTLLNKYLKEY